GTYDGSGTLGGINLYRNGELLNSNTFSRGYPSGSLNNESVNTSIGRWYEQRYYSGLMDSVQIWNKELTQREIQLNMNKELNGDESGLVGYWKFDDLTDPTVAVDSSPNGNHGIIHG